MDILVDLLVGGLCFAGSVALLRYRARNRENWESFCDNGVRVPARVVKATCNQEWGAQGEGVVTVMYYDLEYRTPDGGRHIKSDTSSEYTEAWMDNLRRVIVSKHGVRVFSGAVLGKSGPVTLELPTPEVELLADPQARVDARWPSEVVDRNLPPVHLFMGLLAIVAAAAGIYLTATSLLSLIPAME